ncbi:neuronal acetylcholine receptor subunit beta-4-like [Spodoptera litura]|uniref:Neuronal acetylcholine receptor subunit beta-4-like n=1 Tax=Spodoptera litura TaxID=69820 RepID=A0A9J7IKL1_SPOLT|nr:neuronal acetylcholine receptor subunit beta-4-like [Spodoptera litura]
MQFERVLHQKFAIPAHGCDGCDPAQLHTLCTTRVVNMAPHWTGLLASLLLCIYGAARVRGDCGNATQLSVQLDTLLAEYEREAPPAAILRVSLALDVRHATVDDNRAVMRLLADLKMSWQEPRVRWNASEWGCGSVLTSAERLWLPDVVLLNAAASRVGDAATRARLTSTGAVSWLTHLDVTAPLDLDLSDWPRDTQTCSFTFGSRTYNNEELILDISEFKHAVVFETGAWEMQSVASDATTWQRGPEEVSVATWKVRVSRRAAAQSLGAGAVLAAGALLLGAAAALPPQQRAPLAACASFTAALWLVSALVRLPGGQGTPRALRAMCAQCVCGALSGACAALVVRLARCSLTPPNALRSLLSSLSTLCKLTPSPESCMSSESGTWAAAAVLLDRALSAIILLVLLILIIVQLS